MTNQAGRSDPGILIDEEENRNVHRIWFEICMEKLVKWVVRKSGEIISGEKIETIYKKLTNTIWAKVKDKCEEIPLKNIQKCHKMIFKAFCKEFEDAESVLQALDLNQPIVDHMITQVFIEEAAKLSKRPCCISRFFSFVGRLFSLLSVLHAEFQHRWLRHGRTNHCVSEPDSAWKQAWKREKK